MPTVHFNPSRGRSHPIRRRSALSLATFVGIDTAGESLDLARELAGPGSRCEFLEMDARDLHFEDGAFDVTVCVQNGISAFGVDPLEVLREALRVTRPGGKVLLSSYAEQFWPHRLEWFEAQSRQGLVGAIDSSVTGAGVIVCRDGFRAGVMTPSGFQELCAQVPVAPLLTEVDGSSLFCEIIAPAADPRAVT